MPTLQSAERGDGVDGCGIGWSGGDGVTDPVDAWNLRHPVGTAVVVTKDLGEQAHTQTRSMAQRLPSGTAVIWLDGITGCYLLDRVKAVEGLA